MNAYLRFGAVLPQQRRGFILLMTLMLLTLVALALTAAARFSCAAALNAEEDNRQLQARWAATSCQYTLLPSCEKLLVGQEARTHRPTATLWKQLTLGNLALDLVLSDEQAKVSVPAIIARRNNDTRQAETDLRRILSLTNTGGMLQLRYFEAADSSQAAATMGGGSSAAVGLGDVFDLNQSGAIRRIAPMQSSPGASALLTCWGGGRLNWRRADESALRIILCPPLTYSQVSQFAAARQAQVGLVKALDLLDLDGRQRLTAETALTDGSMCHGLWIIAAPLAEASDRQETDMADAIPVLRRQAILDESMSDPRILCFNW